MKRNHFIEKILTVWGTICSLPVLYGVTQYLIPPARVDGSPSTMPVGKRSAFAPGEVKFVREGKVTLFVRATPSGQLRAFSARCTHLGCLVEYLDEEEKFRCNCHGSLFDSDGNNLSGPAPRPLQPYRVEVQGDDIIVTIL